MKSLFASVLIFLFCSSLPIAFASESDKTEQSEITPGRIHETCLWLSGGDRLFYEFTSSAELRFNIHYHEGNAVKFPVPVKLTALEKAIFEPEYRKHYCLMWKNSTKKTVKLKLRYGTRH